MYLCIHRCKYISYLHMIYLRAMKNTHILSHNTACFVNIPTMGEFIIPTRPVSRTPLLFTDQHDQHRCGLLRPQIKHTKRCGKPMVSVGKQMKFVYKRLIFHMFFLIFVCLPQDISHIGHDGWTISITTSNGSRFVKIPGAHRIQKAFKKNTKIGISLNIPYSSIFYLLQDDYIQ